MKLFGMHVLQSLLGISLLSFVLCCNREPDTYRVTGDVKTRIPWASEGGAYSLQEVTLSGITSLYELSGTYANFYIYPAVSDSKIYGHRPKTRFLKSEELYLPEDDLSQQMAVIYAHLQRLAALDREVGAGGVNKWPRDVGVSVRYAANGKYETNNAFYEGTTDSILVVPYTQNNLPIAVNAGILAHEHFHSLYYKLVEKYVFKKPVPLHGQEIRDEVLGQNAIERLPAPPPQKPTLENNEGFIEDYHLLFSRGINEGLADFWAWIYTGDANFIQASLPTEKESRSLDLSAAEAQNYKFPNVEIWKMRVANRFNPNVEDRCRYDKVSYCLGTEYARTLKRFTNVVQSSRGLNPQQARKLVGAAIVKALPVLKDALLTLKKTEYFEPTSFFTMVENSTEGLTGPEKEFLETLIAKAKKIETLANGKSLPASVADKAPSATITPLPLFSERGVSK
ncbi:MAG: hypothetical protein ACXWRE_09635 [Pseudobdellovibrionaceae bacterium]